jgi:hypothetical protein
MKPLQINLLALGLAIAITTLVYLNVGRGFGREAATALLSIPWSAQGLLLAIAANARRAPSPYISKLTFALWGGAASPFIGLMSPELVFPSWFVVASAPIGFLMCYAGISVFLWMVSLLPRWRFPWAKNT